MTRTGSFWQQGAPSSCLLECQDTMQMLALPTLGVSVQLTHSRSTVGQQAAPCSGERYTAMVHIFCIK